MHVIREAMCRRICKFCRMSQKAGDTKELRVVTAQKLTAGLRPRKSQAVVVHAFKPSTWEAEEGGFLSSTPAWSTEWVPGQPGLYRETLSQKNQKTKSKKLYRSHFDLSSHGRHWEAGKRFASSRFIPSFRIVTKAEESLSPAWWPVIAALRTLRRETYIQG